MPFLGTPELRAFRAEVREFLERELDDELVRKTRAAVPIDRAEAARWQAKLDARGWGAPSWPVAFGGAGWSTFQRYVFEEECTLAGAPPGDTGGLDVAGPLLIEHGTAQQKARFLPPIREGAELWCIAFGDSESGFDPASTETVATADGDDWIIEGRKPRVRNAHRSDLMLCLARTDPQAEPRRALSVFIVKTAAPGITLQPIPTMDEGHRFDAVLFDQVRVPRENLVGALNEGWAQVQAVLASERPDQARAPQTRRDIFELERLARRVKDADGHALIERPSVQRTLAELSADFVALESLVLDLLARRTRGSAPDPAAAAAAGVRGSELQQRVTEAAMSLLGEAGLVLGPDYGSGLLAPEGLGWAQRHFLRRGATIDGGSDEMLRAEIARQVFGTA